MLMHFFVLYFHCHFILKKILSFLWKKILTASQFPLKIFSFLHTSIGACSHNSGWHCWEFSDGVWSPFIWFSCLSEWQTLSLAGSGCPWRVPRVVYQSTRNWYQSPGQRPWHKQISMRHTEWEETRKGHWQKHHVPMTGLSLLPRW